MSVFSRYSCAWGIRHFLVSTLSSRVRSLIAMIHILCSQEAHYSRVQRETMGLCTPLVWGSGTRVVDLISSSWALILLSEWPRVLTETIYAGLFSIVAAVLVTMSVRDLRPRSQPTSSEVMILGARVGQGSLPCPSWMGLGDSLNTLTCGFPTSL